MQDQQRSDSKLLLLGLLQDIRDAGWASTQKRECWWPGFQVVLVPENFRLVVKR